MGKDLETCDLPFRCGKEAKKLGSEFRREESLQNAAWRYRCWVSNVV